MSVKLFEDLLRDKIYACGTMRSDRVGYPTEFKQHLKKGFPNRGDHRQTIINGIIFSIWQDNKVVNVIAR